MPKLPRKSTMIETMHRVEGYAYKLMIAGKLTEKNFLAVRKAMNSLKQAIEK